MGTNTRKRIFIHKVTFRRTACRDAFEFRLEQEVLQQFKKSMNIEQQKRILRNAPIAKYDLQQRKVYMEYPDGRKVYSEA